MFCKKGVLRNFTKLTGKHLCQSFFFDKVAGLRRATWVLLNFQEHFFTEHVRTTASETYQKLQKIYSKTIFNRFLYKLTTEVSLKFNHRIVKQTDGSTMGSILGDIHMIRMEIDVVVAANAIF